MNCGASARWALSLSLCTVLLVTAETLGNRAGAKGGWNGSFASGGDCTSCHGVAAGVGNVQILGAPSSYTLDQTYNLTVRIADPPQAGAGFQISVESAGGTHVGTLIIVDPVNTQVAPVEPGWVTHTAAGVNASVAAWAALGNAAEYAVQWQAPSSDAGPITFFAAGNAINNDFATTGDFIYLTQVNAVAAAPVCDDGVACTDDVVVGGVCVSTPNHGRCPNNGNYCDGVEFCDSAAGCVSSGSPCASGQACVEASDSCAECAAAGDCDDRVACTDNACVNGSCVYTANDARCADNGRFCDGEEFCDLALGCRSDGNPCAEGAICNEAADSCDACQADEDCDDGDPCTTDDTCNGGVCEGEPIPDCCQTDDDCVDADLCMVGACVDGFCERTPVPGCVPPDDTDNDGVPNDEDDCPDSPADSAVDADGCGCDQLDADNDSVNDCADTCADTPDEAEVDEAGCSCDQRDVDTDGVDDCLDLCPETPADASPDESGCAPAQSDDDGDGVVNINDTCPATPAGAETDEVGCPLTDDGDNEPTQPVPGRGLCGLLGMVNLTFILAALGLLRLTRRPPTGGERPQTGSDRNAA